jgi:hypothetical protein
MKRLALIFLVIILLASCIAASPAAKKIIIADDYTVGNCTYLGKVHSYSGHGGSLGLDNAKNSCLNQAAKLGATHLVWTEIDMGWGVSATGIAYRCNR